VFYCGKDCQKKHWFHSHKRTCNKDLVQTEANKDFMQFLHNNTRYPLPDPASFNPQRVRLECDLCSDAFAAHIFRQKAAEPSVENESQSSGGKSKTKTKSGGGKKKGGGNKKKNKGLALVKKQQAGEKSMAMELQLALQMGVLGKVTGADSLAAATAPEPLSLRHPGMMHALLSRVAHLFEAGEYKTLRRYHTTVDVGFLATVIGDYGGCSSVNFATVTQNKPMLAFLHEVVGADLRFYARGFPGFPAFATADEVCVENSFLSCAEIIRMFNDEREEEEKEEERNAVGSEGSVDGRRQVAHSPSKSKKKANANPLRFANMAGDAVVPVLTLNQRGEVAHEDGSSLSRPAPAWSGAPLAPLPNLPDDGKPIYPHGNDPNGNAAVRGAVGGGRKITAAEAGRRGVMVRGCTDETEERVNELVKCRQAEAILDDKDAFPDSFESLLAQEAAAAAPSNFSGQGLL
jgi:hypothetical protein